MMYSNKYIGKKQIDLSFVCIFLLTILFLIWKCQFGYVQYDEGFYLSFLYRFAQGDVLLIDEWHPAQLFSFILLPFMKLYLFIFNSTESIFINWRYITIGLQGIVSIFTYLKLRRENQIGALISAILLFVYIPFGINSLSYNSLGILLLTISFIVYLRNKDNRVIDYIISGFFFAGGVLCCPHLILLYFLFFIVSFYTYLVIIKRKSQFINQYFSFFNFVCFSIGAFIMLGLFCGYLLSNGTVNDYISNIKFILLEPEHSNINFFHCIINYFTSIILHSSQYIVWTIVVYLVLFIILLLCFFDKKRNDRKSFYLFAYSLLCLISDLVYWIVDGVINFQIFPLSVLGLMLFFLYYKEIKKIRKYFYCLWMPGIIYSFCVNMSSNTHFYAISSASIIAGVGTIMIISEIIGQEINNHSLIQKMAIINQILVIFVVILSIFVLRYQTLFWEGSMNEQTERILNGPQKHLLVSKQKKELYDGLLSEVNIIHGYKKLDRIFYLSGFSWLYLSGNERMGAYSCILSYGPENFEVYEKYYNMHREKVPDAVYIEKQYVDAVEWFVKNMDYEIVNIGKYGSLLLKKSIIER